MNLVKAADDLSAFQRALDTYKLLTNEELAALNAGRSPMDPRSPSLKVCEGQAEYSAVKGSSPGFNTLTFGSRDGRVQLVMSLTLATVHRDPAIDALAAKAGDAILCPQQ
ncbi:hypothetical protein AB0I81_01050 [Nonomuraea sp. NPDC050404]|uniref:hypothetical protein n=1 Tax=Nonomuraea sp. NPDC050404 TaxID=3155783 RepID=UPI0033F4A37D